MDLLIDFLTKRGIPFDDAIIAKFNEYYSLLIEYNKKFNLTAITDCEEVQIKHFIDSLYAYDYIDGSVIDIGSGAGFPSIPLAIIRSDVRFTLVDSLNKRVGFLNTVIERLGLNNCRAIHSRAEDLPREEKYNFAIARAVAPLNVLTEYLAPFVKPGGKIIAYKGSNYKDELDICDNAFKTLKCRLEKTEEYNLYSSDAVRSLIILNKVNNCSAIYPRGGNKPRKSPL